MDEIDYNKGFVELRQTSKETVFSVCPYCLPEAMEKELLVEAGKHHGITIIFVSCDNHNPFVFDE